MISSIPDTTSSANAARVTRNSRCPVLAQADLNIVIVVATQRRAAVVLVIVVVAIQYRLQDGPILGGVRHGCVGRNGGRAAANGSGRRKHGLSAALGHWCLASVVNVAVAAGSETSRAVIVAGAGRGQAATTDNIVSGGGRRRRRTSRGCCRRVPSPSSAPLLFVQIAACIVFAVAVGVDSQYPLEVGVHLPRGTCTDTDTTGTGDRGPTCRRGRSDMYRPPGGVDASAAGAIVGGRRRGVSGVEDGLQVHLGLTLLPVHTPGTQHEMCR